MIESYPCSCVLCGKETVVIREPRYGLFGLVRGWRWILGTHCDGQERKLTPAEQKHDRQLANQWRHLLGRRPGRKIVATFCANSETELGYELNPNFAAEITAAFNRMAQPLNSAI